MDLHEGIDWDDVEASLRRASPETLWSFAQMEAKGHKPDVHHADENDYYLGTSSKEPPKDTINCVHDRKAAKWLKENHPDKSFAGSAVEMARTIGMDLMPREYYEGLLLKRKHFFDRDSECWLSTPPEIRSIIIDAIRNLALKRFGHRASGTAFVGGQTDFYSDAQKPQITKVNADSHKKKKGWRGYRKVRKAAA